MKSLLIHYFAYYKIFITQSCLHVETSQLICLENQLTGFCMMTNLAFNELINNY